MAFKKKMVHDTSFTRVTTLRPLSKYKFRESFVKYIKKQGFKWNVDELVFDNKQDAIDWVSNFSGIISQYITGCLEGPQPKKTFFNQREDETEESIREDFPKQVYILEKIKL